MGSRGHVQSDPGRYLIINHPVCRRRECHGEHFVEGTVQVVTVHMEKRKRSSKRRPFIPVKEPLLSGLAHEVRRTEISDILWRVIMPQVLRTR